ncbi:MAG: hypothetical protein EOO88_42535 [Pedobacter sp.]|nr:MAG: hypothetical protein EOO88_42535 [Pedobacter sp.]
MNEPKTVYVVLSYSMTVPDDMTTDQIQEALYEKFQAQSDSSVRLSVRDYHDETESEPWLDLDDVHCGESVQIIIG